jgi:hypothetical protein
MIRGVDVAYGSFLTNDRQMDEGIKPSSLCKSLAAVAFLAILSAVFLALFSVTRHITNAEMTTRMPFLERESFEAWAAEAHHRSPKIIESDSGSAYVREIRRLTKQVMDTTAKIKGAPLFMHLIPVHLMRFS